MTTWWAARRVGDRILCGRRVPPEGPPACMGEIGTVVRDLGREEFFAARPDLVPEYRAGVDGPIYRRATRARFPGARARSGVGGAESDVTYRRRRGRLPYAEVGDVLRCWAYCSHGGHLNRVGELDEDTVMPDDFGTADLL